MRAVISHLCVACGYRCLSKTALEEHQELFHSFSAQDDWSPSFRAKAQDQAEFKGHLIQTPWGQEFR